MVLSLQCLPLPQHNNNYITLNLSILDRIGEKLDDISFTKLEFMCNDKVKWTHVTCHLVHCLLLQQTPWQMCLFILAQVCWVLWPTHLFSSSAKAYPNHDEIVIQFTLIILWKVETNCTKNGFRDSKFPSVKILTFKKNW